MRAVRPFLLLGLLAAFFALAQSQPEPGGGVNLLNFGKGAPTPTTGGVDVSVTNKPTTGYTCTEIKIKIVRVSDGQTLDSCTLTNPGAMVSKSFTGLGSGVKVNVVVQATFQNGGTLDFKDIETTVTTQ